ncbi:MAG: MFS transporter [Bacteroidota bacterium]
MQEATVMPIPLWKKIVFGAGDIYAGGAQQLVGFLYLYFLTDLVGLRPALAGLVALLCKLWDALSDPLFGALSDRTRSRLGRRRPYFLAGTVLIVLSFAALWLPVRPATQWSAFAFFLLVWLFHETVCSMVLVPFYALGGDLTDDYQERNTIMFFRLFLSTLAIITVTLLSKTIVNGFADPRLGYAVMGAVFGLLFSLPWWAIFFAFREPAREKDHDEPSLGRQFLEPLRVRSFRQLMMMFICGYTAVDLMSGTFIYYMTYFLDRAGEFQYVLGVMLAGQFLLLPVALVLSQKLGKRRALILGYTWWLGLTLLMALNGPAWPRWYIYAVAFLMGGGSGAAAFIPWSIYPDVADLNEMVYGARRDGAAGGYLTFARKLSSGLALQFFGAALDMAGYLRPVTRTVNGAVQQINRTQPEAVLWVIRTGLFLLPLILLALGIVVVRRFGLTRETHARIQAILAYRRGAPVPPPSPAEIAALRETLAGLSQAAAGAAEKA